MARDVNEFQDSMSAWLGAAREALVAGGVGEVKVDRLAKRIGITRGSFYWHFAHRKALLDALLGEWIGNNDREVAAIEARLQHGERDFVELFKLWIGEEPGFPAFDLAIRLWARGDAKVAAAVRGVDAAWLATLERSFSESGLAPDDAQVRARVIYFHQLGYYALGLKEPLKERIRLAPAYYRALAGSEPPTRLAKELNRLTDERAGTNRSPTSAANDRNSSRPSRRD